MLLGWQLRRDVSPERRSSAEEGGGSSSFVAKTWPELQANRLMIKRVDAALESSRRGQRVSFFAQRDERVHAGRSTCWNVASENCDAGKNG